jgi:1-acyl-sn-glycerol-3-phosphate acyltransferase
MTQITQQIFAKGCQNFRKKQCGEIRILFLENTNFSAEKIRRKKTKGPGKPLREGVL